MMTSLQSLAAAAAIAGVTIAAAAAVLLDVRRTNRRAAASATERRIRAAADFDRAMASNIDRLVVAAATLTLEEMVAEGCRIASGYVIKGGSIESSRHLAIQDLTPAIRQMHGRQMAQEYRERMLDMPVLLLLTPEAHVAAARTVQRMAASLATPDR